MSLSTSFTPSGGLTITTCERCVYNLDNYIQLCGDTLRVLLYRVAQKKQYRKNV